MSDLRRRLATVQRQQSDFNKVLGAMKLELADLRAWKEQQMPHACATESAVQNKGGIAEDAKADDSTDGIGKGDTSVLVEDADCLEKTPAAGDHGLGVSTEAVDSDVHKISSPISSIAEEVEKEDTYMIRGSAWESVLFVWDRNFSVHNSLFMTGMLVLNMSMQMFMTYVAWTSMSTPIFNESQIEGYMEWRRSSGGRLSYMDTVRQISLATRVCNVKMHSSLELSQGQANDVKNLQKYLKPLMPEGPLFSKAGPLLCIMALLCWYMSVIVELRSILEFLLAVWHLPRSARTTFSSYDADSLAVQSISRRRFATVSLLVGMRLLIVIWLAVCGTFYLAYTEDLSDLVLNAVALQFVIQCDTLIYEAVAPVTIRAMLAMSTPLAFPRASRCSSMTKILIDLSVFIIIASLVAAWSVVLLPDWTFRDESMRALCGDAWEGNLNECDDCQFVYGVSATGIVHWAPSKKIDLNEVLYPNRAKNIDEIRYQRGAYFQGIANTSAYQHRKRDGIRGGVNSLEEAIKKTPAQTGAWLNTGCVDFDEIPGDSPGMLRNKQAIRNSLRDTLQDPEWQSCARIEHLCMDPGEKGIRVRQFCSSICGCHLATSPNPLANSQMGCPESCKFLKDFVTGRECVDVNSTSPSWSSFLDFRDNFLLYAANFLEKGSKENKLVDSIAQAMPVLGCAVLPLFAPEVGPAANLCAGTGWINPVKGFQAWCPETCMCEKGATGCPQSCPAKWTGQAIGQDAWRR